MSVDVRAYEERALIEALDFDVLCMWIGVAPVDPHGAECAMLCRTCGSPAYLCWEHLRAYRAWDQARTVQVLLTRGAQRRVECKTCHTVASSLQELMRAVAL